MSMTYLHQSRPDRWVNPIRCGLLIVGLALLASCATAPERPIAPVGSVSFDAAIDFAVDDLLTQAQRLPDFQPSVKASIEAALQKNATAPARGRIIVDAAIDGLTGQQTAATRLLDTRLLRRAAAKFPQFDVLPISTSNLASGQFLLAATVAALDSGSNRSGRFRINVSLSDIHAGVVVAQASAQARGETIDATPTAFYRDSPSLTKDRMTEGLIRTAQASAGTEADGIYLSGLPVAALITEGLHLYDAGRFADALRVYETALARQDGKQLRVFNGLYLSNIQLGRIEAAEQAFTKIVVLGLGTNSLSVKFLFRPGSKEFLTDSKITAHYSMWLNVLAREISISKRCVSVIGHTSRTGPEQVNDRLSIARASAIQQRLELIAPEIVGRIQSLGMGSRENLIGTGTDDLRDALDRRVEFRVRGC